MAREIVCQNQGLAFNRLFHKLRLVCSREYIDSQIALPWWWSSYFSRSSKQLFPFLTRPKSSQVLGGWGLFDANFTLLFFARNRLMKFRCWLHLFGVTKGKSINSCAVPSHKLWNMRLLLHRRLIYWAIQYIACQSIPNIYSTGNFGTSWFWVEIFLVFRILYKL